MKRNPSSQIALGAARAAFAQKPSPEALKRHEAEVLDQIATQIATALVSRALAPDAPDAFHTHECPKCSTTWFHSEALGGSHECPNCGTEQLLKRHMSLSHDEALALSTLKDPH